jgi:hypothetical protein
LLFLGLLLSSCGGPRTTTQSELPYKKLIQNAEVETRAGNYLAAADNYRKAYDQKPRKKEVLYQAATLYTRARDYKKAANTYQFLEADEQRWPLLGLQYGRALKQDGRYEQARRQLALFREAYNGADRPIVTEIVNNELAGIRLAEAGTAGPGAVDIDRPGRGINTSAEEFGPVAIGGDQLFFTSTQGGQSRLYQSRLQAKEWTKATVPPGFPVIAEGAFGTGSFSADGRSFFFTICSGLTGEDATNRCEIFRGERSLNGTWTQPTALGPAINIPGSNNAYPAVTTDPQGRTLLYFASDRPGGRGGMDLYVCIQQDATNSLSFTTPGNLGAVINTVSDEISPAFDTDGGYIFFASNGHPGFGGLDVFRAAGTYTKFGQPENMGEPVNSAADDYGLVLAANSGRAYLTSNRTYEDEKTTTVDSDIYTLNFQAGRARLKASIYDNTTGSELGGAEITLLELFPGGSSSQLGQRQFPTGIYDFDLRPGSKYRVIIRRDGYQGTEYQVETSLTGSSLYGQPVFLRRNAVTNGQSPGSGLDNEPGPGSSGIGLPTNTGRPTTPAGAPTYPTPPAPSVPNTAPATAPTSPESKAAKTPDAVAYRIQISAERTFDPTAGKYESVRAIGNLQSEEIPGKALRRVTVGYFTEPAAAKAALSSIQSSGFPSAFAVRYDDGIRHGLVRL